MLRLLGAPGRPACVPSTGAASPRKRLLRALQEDEYRIQKSPHGRTVNRDRLIALFKRIQDSISEGESRPWNEKSSLLQTDDFSEDNKPSTPKRRKPKKEKSIPDSQHISNSTVTRPPSNFAKKSPIPSPTPSRSIDHKVAEQFEQKKLSELKGLAKDRGIKGYSKLKKSKLIELLRLQV